MNIAIILAAGQGKRMNAGMNKQFLKLNGKTILEHTLTAFDTAACVDGYLVVAHPNEIDYVRQEYFGEQHPKLLNVVAGGKERQDSVYQGLKALPQECAYVLIHDGARPFVTEEIMRRCLKSAKEVGSGVAGVGVKDTIKQCNEQGIVMQTIPRDTLWSVQTPQVFAKEKIVEAYEAAMQAGYYGTDDASLAEWNGQAVQMVMGDYDNIKMTTQEDLAVGENILKRRGQVCE